MKRKLIWRYYCNFCKKTNCSASSISKHEKHCTMNPGRVCRMCGMLEQEQPELVELIALLPKAEDHRIENITFFGLYETYSGVEEAIEKIMPKLREKAGNCPACILAALRQAKLPIPIPMIQSFNFSQECKDLWTDINEKNKDAEPWL